jgi:hypothetical protein
MDTGSPPIEQKLALTRSPVNADVCDGLGVGLNRSQELIEFCRDRGSTESGEAL